MDLKNFDKQFKSHLENLEVPFDPASWASLENRMNSALSEEQPAPVAPVDLVVKRTLERLEVPYQAADWSLLNARLNQGALVRRIRLSKLAEAALFMLLLINIEGFLGGFKEVLKPAVPATPKSSLPMADAKHRKNIRHRAAATATPEVTGVAALAEQVVALITAPFETAIDGSADAVATNVLPADATPAVNTSVLDASQFYSTSGIVRFKQLAPVPQAKTADFAWNTLFEIIPGVSVPAPHKNRGLYAATYAAFDQNHIKGQESSSRENGFGGGVAVGYRKGKWGVETGMAYAHKQFTPKKDIHIYAGNPVVGFLAAYESDVDADVFSVPVKVTRRFARIGRTSAHVVGGLTTSVATEKRVGYKTVTYPPASPSPDPAPSPGQFPIPNKNNKGLLEGGSLRSNVYATADIGVRVEQPLGKRYVAFVEPSYHHTVGGSFGPKAERINTFTLQAGVMAAL